MCVYTGWVQRYIQKNKCGWCVKFQVQCFRILWRKGVENLKLLDQLFYKTMKVLIEISNEFYRKFKTIDTNIFILDTKIYLTCNAFPARSKNLLFRPLCSPSVFLYAVAENVSFLIVLHLSFYSVLWSSHCLN